MVFEYYIEEFLLYHFLFNYVAMLVHTYHPRCNGGRSISWIDILLFHPVLLLLLYGTATLLVTLPMALLAHVFETPLPYCVVLALQYYVTLFTASCFSLLVFDRELLVPTAIERNPDATMVELQEAHIETLRTRQRQLEQENAELHQRWSALAFPDGTHRPQVPVIQTPLVTGPPEETARRIIRRERARDDEVR